MTTPSRSPRPRRARPRPPRFPSSTKKSPGETQHFKQSHKRRLLAREINQQLHHGRDQ